MSASAYPIQIPAGNPLLHDAHWGPDGTLGVAPQTGWSPIFGTAPAWAFAGGCLSQLLDGSIVCEVSPAAASLMSVATVGIGATPRVSGSQQSAPDFTLDPYFRWLLRFRRRIVGGAPAADFGMELRESANALGASVGGAAAGAGFALCMDGAGGWQLIARRVIAGPLVVQTPITWPNGDTVYTTWEMRIIPAQSATIPAQFQLLSNGALRFSQEWTVGPLPDFTGAGAHYRFLPAVSAGPVGPTDTLLIKASRLIQASILP